MANTNIDEVILGPVDLYQNGERANAEVLNRPIIELRDNQQLHGTMLAQIYAVLGSDNLSLDTLAEVNSKLGSLETRLDSVESDNSAVLNEAGETSAFLGSLSVAESLIVSGESTLNGPIVLNGLVTSDDGSVNFGSDIVTTGDIYASNGYFSGPIISNGEELASKNWVLANSSTGGSTGVTELTKIYSFVGDGIETEFAYTFISESTSIFVDGVLLQKEDYTLWYDDGAGLVENSGVNGVKVGLNSVLDVSSTLTAISYAGADFYTKAEIDAKELNHYTKTEVDTAISDAASGTIDAYTKAEIDAKELNHYTKTEVDTAISSNTVYNIDFNSNPDVYLRDANILGITYVSIGGVSQVDVITYEDNKTAEHSYTNDLLATKTYKDGSLSIGYTTYTYNESRLETKTLTII